MESINTQTLIWNYQEINSETLKEKLQSYKTILNQVVLAYMNKLIDLEYNVLNCTILQQEDIYRLMELDIFKIITAYNIRQRTYNLIKSHIPNESLDFIEDDLFDRLIINGKNRIPRKDFCLYDYRMEQSNKITIDIYQLIDSPFQRKREILLLQKKIEEEKESLLKENNSWKSSSQQVIKIYQQRILEFTNRGEMKEEEMIEMQTKDDFCKLILDEYGIQEKDLQLFDEGLYKTTNMNAVYVKKYPNVTVRKRITYR